METTIQAMLDAIQEVVKGDGPWMEKKNKVLELANEEQKTALYELVAWFE